AHALVRSDRAAEDRCVMFLAAPVPSWLSYEPLFIAIKKNWLPKQSDCLWRGDHVDELCSRHDATCVVRKIHVEGGMHLRIGIVGGRVLHHRHLIAEFGGEPYGRLEARMGDESDHDKVLNAVRFQKQVQVGIGESARAPMLRGDDIAALWSEVPVDLAAPRAVLEGLSRPRDPLNRCEVLPRLVVA